MTLERALTRAAALLTRLVETDSLAAARARELAGRIFAVHLRGFDTALFMTVDDGGVVLARASPPHSFTSLSVMIAARWVTTASTSLPV